MGLLDQATSSRPGTRTVAGPSGDQAVEAADSEPPAVRVNWLFSGVMLGAASWLLILGVIFAALGSWIVAAVLFGGLCLCLLAIWRKQRTAPQTGHGRHRAVATDEDEAA
jgi:hypothetical protein